MGDVSRTTSIIESLPLSCHARVTNTLLQRKNKLYFIYFYYKYIVRQRENLHYHNSKQKRAKKVNPTAIGESLSLSFLPHFLGKFRSLIRVSSLFFLSLTSGKFRRSPFRLKLLKYWLFSCWFRGFHANSRKFMSFSFSFCEFFVWICGSESISSRSVSLDFFQSF